MKTIFTSYFAKSGGSPKAVAISATVPPFYQGKRLLSLAPPIELVMKVKNGQITSEEYDIQYKTEVLDKANAQEIYDLLPDGAILLCYEKDHTDCHRQLVALWLKDKIGIEVREVDNDIDCDNASNRVDFYCDF